jgi:hypothetical protein
LRYFNRTIVDYSAAAVALYQMDGMNLFFQNMLLPPWLLFIAKINSLTIGALFYYNR